MLHYLFAGIVVVYWLVREFKYAVMYPIIAQQCDARGNTVLAARILHRIIDARLLLGNTAKINSFYHLAWFKMKSQQYGEAEAFCRAMLRKRCRPVTQAIGRRRLADCLENQGRLEEAEQERATAAECLQKDPGGPFTLLEEAKTLSSQRRYAESADVYARAIADIPKNSIRMRSTALLNCALACFEAGRTLDAIKWSEEALEIVDQATLKIEAHSIAGLAYNNAGDLEKSEMHRQLASDMAAKLGNNDMRSRMLSQLATVQMERGNLVKSMQACEEAAQLSLVYRRNARTVQAECLRLWGRYEEAKEMLDQARRARPMPLPDLERRMQGIISLGTAWIDTDAGQYAEAEAHLKEAEPNLDKQGKIRHWYDASAMLVAALTNQTAMAESELNRLEAEMKDGMHDRSTLLTCMRRMALTASALGNHERSLAHWHSYLDAKPFPSDLAVAHYCMGEEMMKLGNKEDALLSYKSAVETGLDTHHVQLAKTRLAELHPEFEVN